MVRKELGLGLGRLDRCFLKSLHIIFIMYIIMSETFIKIDSLQHLQLSSETYPMNPRSKIRAIKYNIHCFDVMLIFPN